MEKESGEGKRTLDELQERSTTEDWKGERMRGADEDTLRRRKGGEKNEGEGAAEGQSKMSQALDSVKVRGQNGGAGGDGAATDEVPSANVAHELDLTSLAFREGSHTMTNKTCDLPSQSWRAMKPGYEEVHVPAARSVAPPDEKLIPIADLPNWTHDAFKGMKMLNRVQSKMT